MGETRDPALGVWSLFEGANLARITLIDDIRPWRGETVNRPIEWPVSLRVFFVRDRAMHSVDVSIFEDLHIEYRRETYNMTLDVDNPTQPEDVTGGATFYGPHSL